MAGLAFGVIGGALGFVASGGNPIGAQIGFMAGSAIGGALFPAAGPTLPAQQGPRLNDLRVQISSYGVFIPQAHGSVRMTGNVIWSTNKHEHATTTSQTVSSGGKGGGGGSSTQTTTTYSYTQSFAVLLNDGPIIGVRRIWANGTLIYNVANGINFSPPAGYSAITASATDQLQSANLQSSAQGFTIYTGSETQNPDPLIESYDGTGNVPAYRGRAYVVFNEMSLTNYGNQVPNLEFEVVADGAPTGLLENSIYGPAVLTASAGPYLSPNGIAWIMDLSGSDPWVYTAVNMYSGAIVGQFSLAGAARVYPMFVDAADNLWGYEYAGGGASTHLWHFTPSGLGTELIMSQTVSNSTVVGTVVDSNGNFWANVNGGGIFRFIGTTADAYATTHAGALGINGGAIAGRAYLKQVVAFVPQIAWADINSGAITAVYNSTGAQGAFLIDPAGFIYTGHSDAPNANKLEKLDQDGAAVATLTVTGMTAYSGMTLDHSGNLWVAATVSGVATLLQIATGTFTLTNSGAITGHTLISGQDYNFNSALTFDGTAGAFHVYTTVGAGLIAAGAVDLGTLVTDFCTQTGLTAGDLDVTALTGTLVLGYINTQLAPARAAIQPLMSAFFFDAVESDYKIKFVKRGSSSIVTIPEANLGAHTDNVQVAPDTLVINRAQEMDIPLAVSLSYMDANADYLPGSQIAARLNSLSSNKMSFQMPLVLTAAQGSQIVDALLYSGLMARTTASFQVARDYLAYEPTDVVTAVKDGASYNLRLTKKSEDAAGVITFEGELDEATVYTQTVAGVNSITPTQSVLFVGPTNLALLDIPMLREADNDPGFYYGVSGNASGWRGEQLYQSTDSGASYNPLVNGLMLSADTIGSATTALGSFPVAGNEVFDEYNTVTVTVPAGASLSSVTRTQMLNDPTLNVFLLGNELIQVRTCTLVSGTTYTLSGFLRGRLGTESFMATHAVGDRFVFLSAALIMTIAQSFSDLNKAYLYKPVSIGDTLARTNPTTFTNTGVRRKPLAGVHLGGGRNSAGDLLLQWTPRTRFNGAWLNGVNAPIGESQELYSTVIMNGATEVRAIGSTTPASAYTAAQQTTDFGSPQASIAVAIYQLSPEFGRGYSVTGTF